MSIDIKNHWHLMQTLLSSSEGSNRNKRVLCHGFTEVATFNNGMKEFEDDAALHTLVKYLNGLNNADKS